MTRLARAWLQSSDWPRTTVSSAGRRRDGASRPIRRRRRLARIAIGQCVQTPAWLRQDGARVPIGVVWPDAPPDLRVVHWGPDGESWLARGADGIDACTSDYPRVFLRTG